MKANVRREHAGGRVKKSGGANTIDAPLHLYGLALIILSACLCALAQDYSINWHTIDGGGGTSTNGQYSVTGTIGQPDARTAPITGGQYSLTGGFWGLIAAVQTPGAPYLSVMHSNNMVVVSWPLPAEGWVLERTNALPQTSVSWPQVPPPYQTNATHYLHIEPATEDARFYRLQQP